MTSLSVWDMHGGIHPPERKELTNRTPIQRPALPARLIVPLAQHLGAPAEPCVTPGDRVLKGQKIADAAGVFSAPVHAPTSGVVRSIGPQPYPHASGMASEAIVIDSDGQDQWTTLQPHSDFRSMAPADLLELIRQAGISGLGGAGFPTAAKLAAPTAPRARVLIINGAECEPYITADDLLMREKAMELVAGIEILAHLIQPERVLIGIEDNKPEAIEAVRAAVGEREFQVRSIPTRYPSGGEKQLIQILTGEEVPSGGLPIDIGMLCQNVGTCVAVHDAVLLGKPLISRITTLTGEALARPMNVDALIGTPVENLLEFAGLDASKLNRLIMGGPMMGFTLPSTDVPLIKTTNCLLASTLTELPPPPPALPCIRCGECADVCPASLLPQQLHFFALGQQHDQLKAYNLFDCIECGACAYVCPSNIALVQYYRAAKGEIRTLEQKQHKAEHSRQRFEWRQERLRRAEQQKEADRKARVERAAQAKAAQTQSSAVTPDDAVARIQASKTALSDEQKKRKIEASMAHVALKKAEKQLATHATAELEAQVAALREAAAKAQQALAEATATAPQTTGAATRPTDDEAVKKAKIEAAMLRAQLRKLESMESRDEQQQAELAHLQARLANAEQTLAGAQQNASAEPIGPASDEALKKAKISLAMRRAELNKAEKTGADEAELSKLRDGLAKAEQALHAAEQTSAKPAPELVRTDKRPVSEQARALKTEVAFARADLRRLERDAVSDAALVEAARRRLDEAERKLQEHTDS